MIFMRRNMQQVALYYPLSKFDFRFSDITVKHNYNDGYIYTKFGVIIYFKRTLRFEKILKIFIDIFVGLLSFLLTH